MRTAQVPGRREPRPPRHAQLIKTLCIAGFARCTAPKIGAPAHRALGFASGHVFGMAISALPRSVDDGALALGCWMEPPEISHPMPFDRLRTLSEVETAGRAGAHAGDRSGVAYVRGCPSAAARRRRPAACNAGSNPRPSISSRVRTVAAFAPRGTHQIEQLPVAAKGQTKVGAHRRNCGAHRRGRAVVRVLEVKQMGAQLRLVDAGGIATRAPRLQPPGAGSRQARRKPQSMSPGKSGRSIIPITLERTVPSPAFNHVPARGSNHSAR